MNGAGCRRKGHNFERETAQLLRAIWPGARRGLQYQDGTGVPDVNGTPYHFECKRGRKVNIRAAMAQAMNDTRTHAANHGTPPELARPCVVVAKEDQEGATVTMALEDWMELARRAYPPGDTERQCLKTSPSSQPGPDRNPQET